MKKFHKAILIIHGFAGGTYDQDSLANYLELRRNFDVYRFTLPGHDVKDSKLATCEEWITASENHLKYLIDNGYKEIYLIGHSMGGVIATYLSTKYKEVKKLVLAAPAFTTFASKEEGGLLNAVSKSPDLLKAYSSSEFFTRLTKLPISSLKEFNLLTDRYKEYSKEINVPVLFLNGSIDQIVPIEFTEKLYDELETREKEFITVNDYYHDIFKGEKVDSINKLIEEFLRKRKIKEKKTTI